jgi:hypothetical protein
MQFPAESDLDVEIPANFRMNSWRLSNNSWFLVNIREGKGRLKVTNAILKHCLNKSRANGG